MESRPARLSLSPWYVAIFHDRSGQPLASKSRHKDRYCQHIANIGDEDVREATEAEVERLLDAHDAASVTIYVPTDPASNGEAERTELGNLATEAERQLVWDATCSRI